MQAGSGEVEEAVFRWYVRYTFSSYTRDPNAALKLALNHIQGFEQHPTRALEAFLTELATKKGLLPHWMLSDVQVQCWLA